MAYSYHEHTNMYECNAQETVIAYPTKISIKLIVLRFKSSGNHIQLTDAISGSAGESADDTIIDLYGQANWGTVVLPFDPLLHVFGLKVAAISNSDDRAFVFLA